MNIDDLYPPDDLVFVGATDFRETGDLLVRRFRELVGLEPHHHVLDVGCGIGRVAIPLTQYLNAKGRYEGFDIVKSGIDWCRDKITPRYPNFRFQVADIFNTSYHPTGRYDAYDYRFPYDKASFDFVFLTSVFTHLVYRDVVNYLYEIARVMKRGAKCLITVFLLNDESWAMMRAGKSIYRIEHPYGEDGKCYVGELEVPESIVGYDETLFKALVVSHGLRIDAVRYGHWCGRDRRLDGQDMVLATKTGSPSVRVRLAHCWQRTSTFFTRRSQPRRSTDLTHPVGVESHAAGFLRSRDGFVDQADTDMISGWAWDRENMAAVMVDIYDGGQLLATIPADHHRPDLKYNDGNVGFYYRPPEGLQDGQPHEIHVRIHGSDVELPGSPMMLAAHSTSAFGPEGRVNEYAQRMDGHVDRVDPDMISGWAWDRQNMTAVTVDIYDGDQLLTTIPADHHRPDLKHKDGNFGFRYPTPDRLKDGKPHRIRVKIHGSNIELRGSNKPLRDQGPGVKSQG